MIKYKIYLIFFRQEVRKLKFYASFRYMYIIDISPISSMLFFVAKTNYNETVNIVQNYPNFGLTIMTFLTFMS